MRYSRSPIPTMRSIPAVVAEIRKYDPETAVTEHYIRILVKEGRIPHRNAGRKVLVSMDAVYSYLSGEDNRRELERLERNDVIRHLDRHFI